jgi:hypothetical protein
MVMSLFSSRASMACKRAGLGLKCPRPAVNARRCRAGLNTKNVRPHLVSYPGPPDLGGPGPAPSRPENTIDELLPMVVESRKLQESM